MFHNLKKKVHKLQTYVATLLMVLLLFVLQYVTMGMNSSFYKDASFWTNLGITLFILVVANEIYWRNGSKKSETNEKYIGSTVEYSVRISRIKNHSPSLTEDFYKFIDEKNTELYTSARNQLLDSYGIMQSDYYQGSVAYIDGVEQQTRPHSELTVKELKALTRQFMPGIIVPYYTAKQIKIIRRAVLGKFHYETLNATEILSGSNLHNKKFATTYNANKNKAIFTTTSAITSVLIAVITALLLTDLSLQGWSVVSLFTFVYRLFILAWRSIASNEAGYNDVAEVKRGVNINRANITTMYAAIRNYDDLFKGIDLEIQHTKEYLLNQNTTIKYAEAVELYGNDTHKNPV